MAVSTDKEKIEHLLKRRVVDCMVEESLRKKLLSGKKLRVKFGADPTKPDLHIGHAVPLKKLKEFQDLGHQVVFIVGDYTALVGDPSGKSKTRPMLSEHEVKENAKTYIEQVGRILDLKKLEIRPNSEWFSKMGFNDVIKLAAQFTVARTMERDDFNKRYKEGTDIHLHELLYPAMQAYDSIMVEADVEIGSSDQRFNILAGRDLQRKMGKPEQDCLFLGPILVGMDGAAKMSKSLGNYIGISEAPEEMLGKTMSIPDSVIWDWFNLVTDLPEEEIAGMRSDCEKGQMNPRDAKMRLAKEIVSQYHPAGAADRAEEHFNNLFRKKEVPDEIPEVRLTAGERTLVELLVEAKLTPSKGEARRLVEQGGIKVGGEVVCDISAKFAPTADGTLIQKGKRHFVKIIKK
jgi:tyrosyl-tRNA synthetase